MIPAGATMSGGGRRRWRLSELLMSPHNPANDLLHHNIRASFFCFQVMILSYLKKKRKTKSEKGSRKRFLNEHDIRVITFQTVTVRFDEINVVGKWRIVPHIKDKKTFPSSYLFLEGGLLLFLFVKRDNLIYKTPPSYIRFIFPRI